MDQCKNFKSGLFREFKVKRKRKIVNWQNIQSMCMVSEGPTLQIWKSKNLLTMNILSQITRHTWCYSHRKTTPNQMCAFFVARLVDESQPLNQSQGCQIRIRQSTPLQLVCPAGHPNPLSLWNVKKLHNAGVRLFPQTSRWMADNGVKATLCSVHKYPPLWLHFIVFVCFLNTPPLSDVSLCALKLRRAYVNVEHFYAAAC